MKMFSSVYLFCCTFSNLSNEKINILILYINQLKAASTSFHTAWLTCPPYDAISRAFLRMTPASPVLIPRNSLQDLKELTARSINLLESVAMYIMPLVFFIQDCFLQMHPRELMDYADNSPKFSHTE